MALRRTYLDHNATTPLSEAARRAMIAALDLPGNPSSVHGEGRTARALVEAARASVARLAGVPPAQIVFTSGGTEAAALVLTPHLTTAGDARPFDLLLVGAGEHACVLQGHGFGDRCEIVALDRHGVLDIPALRGLLDRHPDKRVMLALQAANNETGVRQPTREAAALVHQHGGFVVCDAVQALGRFDASVRALGVDALFCSAHKLGGPKGIGMVAFADARTHIHHALLRGGGQERGLRAGTENVAAIAGFGAAADEALADCEAEWRRVSDLRDGLEARLRTRFADLVVFGDTAPRLANTSAFALADVPAETLLMALDLDGFAVSSGSACSSGKVRPSHVLAAMGFDGDVARGAIRVSLGRDTAPEDVERFALAFETILGGIRTRRKRAA